MAEAVPQYRLVVFEEIEDPQAVRDLFCRVTHLHPTDAMQWVARAPGTWPWPLPADEVRALLDGLYELGVAAEAWLVGHFPELSPPRNVHSAACLAEGFRVKGLRGEPTHWVPWKKIELLSAGRIEAEDEYRHVVPPRWSASLALGVKALFKRPGLPQRRARAMRIPRDPVGEIIIVRNDPRIAFRVVENRMNYAYLGDRRQALASENFPIFVAELCARADDAYLTPATRSFLERREPGEHDFSSSQALLEYSTHRLLWSWYRRDRESGLRTQS